MFYNSMQWDKPPHKARLDELIGDYKIPKAPPLQGDLTDLEYAHLSDIVNDVFLIEMMRIHWPMLREQDQKVGRLFDLARQAREWCIEKECKFDMNGVLGFMGDSEYAANCGLSQLRDFSMMAQPAKKKVIIEGGSILKAIPWKSLIALHTFKIEFPVGSQETPTGRVVCQAMIDMVLDDKLIEIKFRKNGTIDRRAVRQIFFQHALWESEGRACRPADCGHGATRSFLFLISHGRLIEIPITRGKV